MLRLFLKPMLIVGIGITGAGCLDDGSAAPQGYNQPAYNQPAYYQPAYYQPAPGYTNPNYNNSGYRPQQGNQGGYYQGDGRRYTTVSVTNRGQNGNRDDVVQQQVACGSQYYDGFRTRTAPRC